MKTSSMPYVVRRLHLGLTPEAHSGARGSRVVHDIIVEQTFPAPPA